MAEEVLTVPRLETERLILRSMSLDDLEFIIRHFSDYETNRYSDYEGLKNREEAIEFYKRFLELGKPSHFRLGVVLKETGELVGTLGYHNFSRKDFRTEIGYDLYKTHWGKGFMTEAVRAIIRYGFEQMNLNRIEATMNSENLRSIKLLERLGFQKEGLLREKYYCKGRFQHELVYSLLRKDWEKLQ